jgi:hypothetical protein
MAAVRAAAIRIQRPAEGHSLDAVQRRSADDLLIARLIGPGFGLGQRCGSTVFHEVRDLAGSRLPRSEIEQKRMRTGHVSSFIRHIMSVEGRRVKQSGRMFGR